MTKKEKVQDNKNGHQSNCKVGWYRMPSALTTSQDIPPRDYRVLALLLERENLFITTKGIDRFRCCENWIADASGISIPSVKRSIRWLSQHHYIKVDNDGRNNRYTIGWDHINALESGEFEHDNIQVTMPALAAAPTTTVSSSTPPASKPEPQAPTITSTPEQWRQCLDACDFRNLFFAAETHNEMAKEAYLESMLRRVRMKYPDADKSSITKLLLRPTYRKWKETGLLS